MKKKLLVLVLVAVFLVMFIIVGIPGLQKLKKAVNKKDARNDTLYGNIEEVDEVRVMNHYAEIPCRDSVTGKVDLLCQTAAGCDNICRHENKGCSFYDMVYNGSDFSENKCKCLCKKKSFLEVGMKSMK